MEVRIRLQRIGKKTTHRANYRIVAVPKNKGRDGTSLDILGHYDPTQEPAVLEVDHNKVEKWINNGATLSDTVRSLIKKAKKK